MRRFPFKGYLCEVSLGVGFGVKGSGLRVEGLGFKHKKLVYETRRFPRQDLCVFIGGRLSGL